MKIRSIVLKFGMSLLFLAIVANAVESRNKARESDEWAEVVEDEAKELMDRMYRESRMSPPDASQLANAL